MRQTRNLWASVIFVAILVVASLTGFASGALKPKLGLDLEGGISVILQAPEGTSRAVMNQALESIRKRVDAFGVGEPQIAVSANTIEVQIPGGANGTVQQRAKDQYCLVGQGASNFGCADTQDLATKALAEIVVISQPSNVCLEDASGKELGCYASVAEAQTVKAGLTVTTASAAPLPSQAPSASASGSASPSASASPPPSGGSFCLTDASSGTQLACYPTSKAATAAQKALVTKNVGFNYCLTAPATVVVSSPSPTPPASPSGSASPSKPPKGSPSASASDSASPSVSTSPAPTTKLSAYSQLSQPDPPLLPLCQSSRKVADTMHSSIAVTHETTEYCVISSANKNLGCYLTKNAAQTKQQETGQDRLLAIIGKTARLEQRQVLSIIQTGTPTFNTTPVTCGTTAQQATKACSFDALRDQKVVYLDQTGSTKYQLGPVVISGDQVTKATAVLNSASQSNILSEWIVDFSLDSDGSKAFADITTRLAALPSGDPQKQIAIIVDRQVISAPSVNGPITGGSGQISGGFTEAQAKDLATVLSAGALPVDLSVQSVTTISPTLGSQSLREGIIAGVAGLLLLFLYVLFYYRLLGVVAIVGMTIWGILALALVSLAGSSIGYALTLAGVAGLVISLGVTTDSYIVFFERLKDEVRSGRSARSAVQPAFKRAYRTIVAADVVTGIAALVLYLTAVSSVRGFALTLGVATLLDLFVVWFFKRPTVFLIARNQRLVELPGFGLESGVAANLEPGEIVGPAGDGA